MAFLQEIPRQGKRWGPLLVAGALAGLIASIPRFVGCAHRPANLAAAALRGEAGHCPPGWDYISGRCRTKYFTLIKEEHEN